MRKAACILCESSGVWHTALASLLDTAHPAVWFETRSLAQARDRWRETLREGGRPLLIVELTAANAEAVCRLLIEHEAEVAGAPRLVVAGRSDAQYEGAAREAGATLFCTSPREIRPLANLIARFATAEASRPEAPDERSTAERLRAGLPWPGTAR
jgi:hypothetical protein